MKDLLATVGIFLIGLACTIALCKATDTRKEEWEDYVEQKHVERLAELEKIN